MKRFLCFFSVSLFVLSLSLLLPKVSIAGGGIHIPGKYIVVLKHDAGDAASVGNDMAAKGKINNRGHAYGHALKGFAANIPDHKLKDVRNDPRVDHVEPDLTLHSIAKPTDKGKPDKSACRGGWKKCPPTTEPTDPTASTQVIPTGIERINAHLNTYANIDGVDERIDVDVAVIDTGVSNTHPDINFFNGVSFTGPSGGVDDNGHGSHVAGTIGAIDNNEGVVGVAPGARIWAVKVLDSAGSGYLSNLLKGIDYVTANAADIEVANMSLGFQGTSIALDTAISNSVAAGVTYVAAAGNSAIDTTLYSPAGHPDILTVSAIVDTDGKSGGLGSITFHGLDDTFALFSNFGEPVTIAAPGVNIRSTWMGDLYRSASGTSMAAPHVAGAAALHLAAYPSTDPASVKANLLSRATLQYAPDGFSGDPDVYSEPLLNIEY